jgi:hypothetical protein
MFDGLYLSRLRFNLRLGQDARLPEFVGSTLRGAFGTELRRMVCPQNRNVDCGACPLAGRCVFSYLFVTPAQPDAPISHKNKEYAHPYVFEPLPVQPVSDVLSFNLVLVGRGVEYLPYITLAFNRVRLGQTRAGSVLESIEDALDGGMHKVFDGRTRRFVAMPVVLDYEAIRTQTPGPEKSDVTLRFVTPTQITFHQQFVQELTFPVLVRALLRRFGDLAEYHCGVKPQVDYRRMVDEAERVAVAKHDLDWNRDIEQFSFKQNQRQSLHGLLGEVVFAAVPSEYLPLLRLGEYLHVGSKTAKGLGQYEMEMRDEG